MKKHELLTFDPHSLPEEGVTVAGEIFLADLEISDTDRMAAPSPATFKIDIRPVHGGVLAEGRADVTLRSRCDRCLKYFDLPLQNIEICHFFKISEIELIDLTNDVREDILLSFPQHIFCREDCRGLCPNCGQNLNVRDCGCLPASDIDGTWDVLDELQLGGDHPPDTKGRGNRQTEHRS